MILLAIICVLLGYIVGKYARKRSFVNYNKNLRKLAMEVCFSSNPQSSINRLSKFLGVENETKKQTLSKFIL